MNEKKRRIVYLIIGIFIIFTASFLIIAEANKIKVQEPESERIRLEELTIERRFQALYQPERLLYGQGKIDERVVDEECFKENRENLEELEKCSYTSNLYYFDHLNNFSMEEKHHGCYIH